MERALELAVLALAAARGASTLAMPAARRELHDRSKRALREHSKLALAAAAFAAAAAVAWAAVAAPLVLRVLAVLVAAAWLALAIRARDGYGRRRGLPPGSLGLRPSLAAVADPSFLRDAFRRHGPIVKMAQIHRPVVCVLGLDTGRELLRRHAAVLTPAPVPLNAEIPRGFLRYMAPDDHARYSRLFRAAVSEAALQAIAPYARTEASGLLADLAATSRDAASGVDPAPAIMAYLHRALLRLYFGGLLQPEDDAAIARWLADAAVDAAVGRAAPAAVRALRGFEALIATRAAAYDATADPSIWGELVRLDPASAHDRTVAGNLFLLLAASEHSIGGLLRWMLVMLCRVPEWCDRVRAGAAGDDPYTYAVYETLRLAQSEYIYREVTAPIAVGPFMIPRGWLLRICVAESHRDETLFPRPDEFVPDRHRARRYTTSELSPFGLDLHACLGARMSLLFGRILAEQLTTRFACTAVEDGPRERANRHWHHWEPSARFRVRILTR